jgi:hypothetical protein
LHVAVVLSEDSPDHLWVTIAHHGREDGYTLLFCVVHSGYRDVKLGALKLKKGDREQEESLGKGIAPLAGGMSNKPDIIGFRLD